jgi:hypothetical protein
MTQALLVTLIVTAAALHVAWHLLPVAMRRQLAHAAARHAGHRIASWLGRHAAQPTAHCGDCGGKDRCPATRAPAPDATTMPAHRLIASSRG